MTHTASAELTHSRVYSFASALKFGALGGLVAALGNLVVWLIGVSLIGDQLATPLLTGGFGPLPPSQVALISFIPGVGAGLVLWMLDRWLGKPWGIFTGIALSILLFSFTAPLGMAVIPDAARVFLSIMHVVAAGAILGILYRYMYGK